MNLISLTKIWKILAEKLYHWVVGFPPVRDCDSPLVRAVHLMPPVRWNEKAVAWSNMNFENLCLGKKWPLFKVWWSNIHRTIVVGVSFFLARVNEFWMERADQVKIFIACNHAHNILSIVCMPKRFGAHSIPVELISKFQKLWSKFRLNHIFFEFDWDILFCKVIIFSSVLLIHSFHKLVISHILAAIFFDEVSKLVWLSINLFYSDEIVTCSFTQVGIVCPQMVSWPRLCQTFYVHGLWLAKVRAEKVFVRQILMIVNINLSNNWNIWINCIMDEFFFEIVLPHELPDPGRWSEIRRYWVFFEPLINCVLDRHNH